MIARAADRTFIATANPGLLMSVVVGARDARHLRIGREGRAARLDLGRDRLARARRRPARRSKSSRARATPGRRTRRGANGAAPYANADGSPITSPKARYLQWRAVLTGTAAAAPVLTSLSSAYLPRNIRPQVVVDHRASARRRVPEAVLERRDRDRRPRRGRAGQARRRRTARPAAALRRSAAGFSRRGLQTFQWKADDDNNDELSYDVFYRREGDTGVAHVEDAICATRCWCGTPARCRTAPTS